VYVKKPKAKPKAKPKRRVYEEEQPPPPPPQPHNPFGDMYDRMFRLS